MVNLNTVLNERIARISRREIKAQTGATRKAASRYRGDIAALKRQIQSLTKRLAGLERQAPRQSQTVPTEVPEGVRYSPRTVRALRARLGISAKDFGMLAGVSGLTVYNWESGQARPRNQQLAKLVGLRGIGKREAMRRLVGEGGMADEAEGTGRRRGSYKQSAEEFVHSLVQSRSANSSAAVNAAWQKSGRPGRANNTLTRMVQARKLKRVKLPGVRGGTYAVA